MLRLVIQTRSVEVNTDTDQEAIAIARSLPGGDWNEDHIEVSRVVGSLQSYPHTKG